MSDLEITNSQSYDTSHKQKLLNKVNTLLVKNCFKQGDLIVWKNGLRNKKLPDEGQPAVVLEVLNEPLTQHEQETGSPYFREPLDIVLAMLDEDEDLVSFYYDSRRFELYRD